jgi:hypothetical protein
MRVPANDRRWKTADAQLSAPDPLAYKAFFTEYKQGEKSAKEEVGLGTSSHPETIPFET